MMAAAADERYSSQMARTNPPGQQSAPQVINTVVSLPSISSVSTSTCRVANVHSPITRDVEKLTECSIDEMLKVFLVDPIDDLGSSDKHTMFRNCLETVFPICNGSFQAKGLKANLSGVKHHLKAYSEKYRMNESEICPDFVQAVNAAFLCLQLLHAVNVRPCSHSVYFHCVNDPSLLMHSHQGKVSQCKPDIILVPEDVLKAHGLEENISDLDDLPLNTATKQPRCPFKWRSVRAFVECGTYKYNMEAPPETYTCQLDTPKRKHLAHVLDHELSLAQLDMLSVVPMSSGVNSRPPPCQPHGLPASRVRPLVPIVKEY
ncbi:hypothetical protein EDC04DRAFT_772217 [Pisolithus marmoratus]|nr:hypothetical protein EDC04DRAFT_772217 [Pisolithus marmoratus]